MGLHSRLFTRLLSRNREVYALKVITLAIAFASSVLVTLFSLNEFGYDKFHEDPGKVFRVLQKNTDEHYSGNRLSAKIPDEVIERMRGASGDSIVVSRVKIMNKVTVLSGNKRFHDRKIHGADPSISRVFSFRIIDGNAKNFNTSHGISVMLSSQAALDYTGTTRAAGKKIKLYTFEDSVEAEIVAVFKTFPQNSHEEFNLLMSFNVAAIMALNFNPDETGVYGRILEGHAEDFTSFVNSSQASTKMIYSLQPLPEMYFGPRVPGEEARHGDRYSVIILVCIASLILFLALTGFVNLTTITLPHRSKEIAMKKLAGASGHDLLLGFLQECAALVMISLLAGVLILIAADHYTESILGLQMHSLILTGDVKLAVILAMLFTALTLSPLFMVTRFIRATPNRLLSTDTITFPGFKRLIMFLQLGISIFLIIASLVVRRQISYSLLKEPGRNHDQVVYLNSPAGITNQGINTLRSNWKKFNPNILDVMAVSQLPDRISSKEPGSEFYQLKVDRGFLDFFSFRMKEGNWFKVNDGDSVIVTNEKGKARMNRGQANVIGVMENLGGQFNQPEQAVKIMLAPDYNYNWLCVRVLEVDIRRTVRRLSDDFSIAGQTAEVNFLNRHFESWIDYQDRLNSLSGILTIISALLSCCAIYGLSVSLARDRLKEIAVHRLFGARTLHITWLLVSTFAKQMAIALIFFGPVTYILLNELLRTFVYATRFSWLDPLYPIGYCAVVITMICGFQALSLNRSDFASTLRG